MAYIVLACIVMAYVVNGLCNFGLQRRSVRLHRGLNGASALRHVSQLVFGHAFGHVCRHVFQDATRACVSDQPRSNLAI